MYLGNSLGGEVRVHSPLLEIFVSSSPVLCGESEERELGGAKEGAFYCTLEASFRCTI